MTNREKAEQARHMIEAHPLWASDYTDDVQTGLGDVLADLKHFCRLNGHDFEEAVRMAHLHHDEESDQGDDVETV